MKTPALFPLLALSAATALLLTAQPSSAFSAEGDLHDGMALSRPASPSPAPLHGITVRLTPEGRVVVGTCTYEAGVAVAGAQVTVFAPGGEAPNQTATTDPTGLFAFVPGAPGEWRVVVDDGVGHRREARIQVGADGVPGIGGQEAASVADVVEGEHEPEDHTHDAADHVHEAGDQLGHTHEAPEATSDAAGAQATDAAAGEAQVHSHGTGDSQRPWQLATGLSLIFGLTGFAYGFRARRPAP